MIPDLPIYCKSDTEKFSFLNHVKAGCPLDGCPITQMLSHTFPPVPFPCVSGAKLSKSGHSHCSVASIQFLQLFRQCPLSTGLREESHVALCSQVSFVSSSLEQFLRLPLAFMILTPLKIAGQLCCKWPSVWGVWCVLPKRLRLCIFGRNRRRRGAPASRSIRVRKSTVSRDSQWSLCYAAVHLSLPLSRGPFSLSN